MNLKFIQFFFNIFLLACYYSSTVYAETPLVGKKTLVLFDVENNPTVIGHIQFDKLDKNTIYKIEFEDEIFSDEFLSMRPFKCIHVSKQMVCHLVYPYEKQGYITSEDLTDLEYDLLFLHKSATEYGINAWNGLYYRLAVKSDHIVGSLNEVDLNVLAAPPDDGVLRPITSDMLFEAELEQHTFPRLEIK